MTDSNERRSWKYPEDFKQEIRDMLAEGLTTNNVAWYLDVPTWVVKYYKNPQSRRANQVRWESRNTKSVRKTRDAYNKRYSTGRKQELLKQDRETFGLADRLKKLGLEDILGEDTG